MHNLLRYIIGFIVAGLFLLATTGVRMYSHHCSTTNTDHSSLFESLATCERHAVSLQTVHSVEKESCCSEETHQETPITAQDDCCHNDSQFYKITNDFNLNANEQFTIAVKEVALSIDLLDQMSKTIENDACSKWFLETYHPPPLIFGRKLIEFLQHQKTDPNPFA